MLLGAFLASCAGTHKWPEGVHRLGRDTVPRGALIIAMSMKYAGGVCGDPEVRACLLISDEECVRTIGDAVLATAPIDVRMMTGEQQIKWNDELGLPAANRAGDTIPMREPCDGKKTTPKLGGISVRNEGGIRCVRRDGDETPCAR